MISGYDLCFIQPITVFSYCIFGLCCLLFVIHLVVLFRTLADLDPQMWHYGKCSSVLSYLLTDNQTFSALGLEFDTFSFKATPDKVLDRSITFIQFDLSAAASASRELRSPLTRLDEAFCSSGVCLGFKTCC